MEIPNNGFGKIALRIFKKCVDRKHFTVRYRGRDKDRVGKSKKYGFYLNMNHDIPVKYADRIAVYIQPKKYKYW